MRSKLIRIEDEIDEALRDLAYRTRIHQIEHIRKAIEEYLSRINRKKK